MSEDFESRFQGLIDAAEDTLQTEVHRIALKIQDEARRTCPTKRYGTGGGSLRESIRTYTEKTEDGVRSEVYTNSIYAPFVEFGTGSTGQAHHKNISPNIDPVYSQSGWTMPADAMSPEDAEQYGFGIARGKDGEIIGYYTKGQVARPFLYPAFKSKEKTVAKEIEEALAREMERRLK
jgi:HK97 gp10 family phage protein